MDRRKSLKVMTLATLSAGTLLKACNTEPGKDTGKNHQELYGRTEAEIAHDANLQSQKFFTDHELATLTVLCDLIIPADDRSGSASDAGVPDFIEFTMKDRPAMQDPMRGGLRWLDMKTFKLFNRPFINAATEQQVIMVDMIAYPEKASRDNAPGVAFFNTVRNLTASGFFTSRIGLDDLQYMGNTPNAWAGVPTDVLEQYGLEYDAKTLAVCLDPDDRGKLMVWE